MSNYVAQTDIASYVANPALLETINLNESLVVSKAYFAITDGIYTEVQHPETVSLNETFTLSETLEIQQGSGLRLVSVNGGLGAGSSSIGTGWGAPVKEEFMQYVKGAVKGTKKAARRPINIRNIRAKNSKKRGGPYIFNAPFKKNPLETLGGLLVDSTSLRTSVIVIIAGVVVYYILTKH